MQKDSKIFVAGHRGLVGSAIFRNLKKKGYSNIVVRTSKELDLRDQSSVYAFYEEEKPEYVFVAAAKVGGIYANDTYRGQFIYDNLSIQNNLIHGAYLYNVKKLLFLGSSCIYPKYAEQPIKEEYLLTGTLEPTTEPYAIAKIAGIKMCDAYRYEYGCDFISAMPTNLYGPNDSYDYQNSHVLPALLRKIHEAKISNMDKAVVWGTGKPNREFLHSDDMADACVFLMNNYSQPGPVNVGTGLETSIADLAAIIKEIVGFKGDIVQDTSKPDGTPRKLMDVSKLTNLGWTYTISLPDGIKSLYEEIEVNGFEKK